MVTPVISLTECPRVTIIPPGDAPPRAVPCCVSEDLVIIDKPAGILTHADGTGALGCAELFAKEFGKLLVVHRLDRETSGVLVLARKPATAAWLTQQFEQRRVQKLYHFVTMQPIADQRLEVRSYIDKVRGRLISKPPVGKWLDKANSHTVLEFEQELSAKRYLWRALPTTGKTHQIRLHAKAAGVPIMGDSPAITYRTNTQGEEIERLFLHASKLELMLDPDEDVVTEITAALPRSFC